MTEKRAPESVAQLAGYALGMSAAFALFSLRAVDRLVSSDVKPFQHWIGYVIAVAMAAVALVPQVRRSPYYLLAVCGLIPITVGSGLATHFGFQSVRGHEVRSIGVVIAFAAEFLVAVWFFRQKQELDKQIYTSAGLVSFFVTVGVAVVYGAAEESFGAPHLALTWLALFALAAFVIGLTVFEKRYV